MDPICCTNCGTPKGMPEYHAKLRDLYQLRKDGKQFIEPLVFFPGEDDDWESSVAAMDRNMFERGLCPGCGLPDLRGMTEDDFYSEDDAREMAELAAEEAAERRMGC